MKKYFYFVIFALISTIIFTSCTSNKAINIAKEYVDEYYQNFNFQQSTQCYYQLNKNSSDIIKENYGAGVEDFLSSRSRILGQVIEYEILNEEYHREGQDKFIDFDIQVKYQNADLQEKQQIIIKRDGQKSINIIEYPEDNITTSVISEYKKALIMNDMSSVENVMSRIYYLTKTNDDLTDLLIQASIFGGKLWGGDVLEEKYIFEQINDSAYVYEVILELKYENDTMVNQIKLVEDNGFLGIGYISIIPNKITAYIENYAMNIKDKEKEKTLSMFDQSIFQDDEKEKETKWTVIQSYSEAYGELTDYEVLSYETIEAENTEGPYNNSIQVEVFLNYEKNSILHKLILKTEEEGYKICKQIIIDD